MEIKIQFVSPVSRGRLEHCLKNVKKIVPSLRGYLFEVLEDKYLIKDEDGSVLAEFKYFVDESTNVICFDSFKGKFKDELEKMLVFDFAEEVGLKGFVFNKQKKWKMYFDGEWFLIEKSGVYKIGLDREKLMKVDGYRIPLEVR
jgi:hypothetical protein